MSPLVCGVNLLLNEKESTEGGRGASFLSLFIRDWDKRQPAIPKRQIKRQCLNYQDIYAPNAPVLTLDKGNRRKRQQNDTI